MLLRSATTKSMSRRCEFPNGDICLDLLLLWVWQILLIFSFISCVRSPLAVSGFLRVFSCTSYSELRFLWYNRISQLLQHQSQFLNLIKLEHQHLLNLPPLGDFSVNRALHDLSAFNKVPYLSIYPRTCLKRALASVYCPFVTKSLA